MTDSLFVAFQSDVSRRTAVIAEEIGSIWLYLSKPDERAPERDCWLLNTDAEIRDREFYRQQQSPPPAPPDHILDGGTVPVPDAERWSALWSSDGNSVVALLDGQAIGFIVAGDEHGHARYISGGATPWALPWSEHAYNEAFR